MNKLGRYFVIGVVMFSLSVTSSCGQTSSSPNGASQQMLQQQSTILGYQREQSALGAEYRTLVNSGASAEQIQRWIENNTSRIQAQAGRANTMTLASGSNGLPVGGTTRLPSEVTSAASNYVSNQGVLNRLVAPPSMRVNALVSGSTSSLSQTQAVEASSSSLKTILQENASALNQQRQLAATLAEASIQQRPFPWSPATIPSGASPEVISFLRSRNQLSQQYAQFQMQYATSNVTTRAAAMVQWRKQNAALILQLQTEANNMTTAADAPSGSLQN